MKRVFTLFCLVLSTLSAWGQEVVFEEDFNHDSLQYHYQVQENILQPNRKILVIRRLIEHDSVNDVAGNFEAFHTMIRLTDHHKEKGTVHVRIYYAEPSSYSWKSDPRNYMEVVFHVRHKEIWYKSHGDKMQENKGEAPLRKTKFEPKDTKKMDMVKIAVEQFIVHYDGLFKQY